LLSTGVDTHSHTLWSHAALIVMPGSLLFSSGLMFVGWFVLTLISLYFWRACAGCSTFRHNPLAPAVIWQLA